MSQRNPKLIDMEFAPARERRAPAALDETAVTSGVEGATSEIRSLMDQLQQTANEARHRLRSVEDERDSLSEQVQTLQEQTRDLRGRVAESGILGQQLERMERERQELESRLQTAQDSGRRLSGAETGLREAERQRDEALRVRDATARQRDELVRSVDALHRTVAELNERGAGGQTQLVNLRQARDAAQSQNRELTQKLSALEDVIADLEYRLEKAALAPAAPAENPAWESEREDLCRQIVELQTRLTHSAAGTRPAGEMEELAAARDAALAEAAALRAQVERLRQSGEQGPASEAFDSLRHERDSTLVQVQMATREVIDLRTQLEARRQELAAAEEAGQALSRQAEEIRARFKPIAEEQQEAVRAREEALTSLASAQKQIERIAKERDLLRDNGTEQMLALEKQVGQEKARLEAQRLETIELGTRLHSAQEQVRALSASLAEARLLARAPAAKPAPLPALEVPVILPFTPAPLAIAPAAQPPAPAVRLPVPFPSAETHETVRTLRRCYQAYSRAPDDLSHLNELHCAAHTFAEEAREGGCLAVQRVGAALAQLVQELYHFPEQITSEVLTTVVQSIEFLGALLKVRDLAHLKDPASGTVCVVDDDAATRECLIMALETVMVQILAFREPTEALCALASTPCDLILLDVQMPGMDGYELCSAIRQHALHRHTPVVFVTGQSGVEVRAKCTLCGGNDFLSKPFILAELALKALMMIVRTELHLAV